MIDACLLGGSWSNDNFLLIHTVTCTTLPCPSQSPSQVSESRWRSRCKAATLSVVCRIHDVHHMSNVSDHAALKIVLA